MSADLLAWRKIKPGPNLKCRCWGQNTARSMPPFAQVILINVLYLCVSSLCSSSYDLVSHQFHANSSCVTFSEELSADWPCYICSLVTSENWTFAILVFNSFPPFFAPPTHQCHANSPYVTLTSFQPIGPLYSLIHIVPTYNLICHFQNLKLCLLCYLSLSISYWPKYKLPSMRPLK